MQPFKIELSRHAVQRFQERVRPALDLHVAAEELRRIVAVGRIATESPRWHADWAAQEAPFYLLVGALVLPLRRSDRNTLIAVTCLARGDWSDDARRRRNARRRAHRSR